MARRSYSDVPNRIVHLFLQEVGHQYDVSRGLKPFRRLSDVYEFLGAECCYCGAIDVPLVEEHVIPRNRVSVGLHSWGNVVPACVRCNREKSDKDWATYISEIAPDAATADARIARIAMFRDKFGYAPSTEALRHIVDGLYTLADSQARALVSFAVKAASAAILELGGAPLSPEHGEPL